MNEHIITESANGIFTIRFNRPDKKNAITNDMYQRMYEAAETALNDPAVRVLFFRGSDSVFTGGNDLMDFMMASQSGRDLNDIPVIRFIQRMIAFPKPVVAAVNGPAIGIGTTLLLHCDAVVAGESTRFQMPFTQLALVPEFGSSYLLPLIAGKVRASHLLLLGESFDTATARESGIISHSCPDAEVIAAAEKICQQFAALPPRTLRRVKRLILTEAQEKELRAATANEAKQFLESLNSEEAKEAFAAFFQKRPADYSKFE